jgi:hypothetical protein
VGCSRALQTWRRSLPAGAVTTSRLAAADLAGALEDPRICGLPYVRVEAGKSRTSTPEDRGVPVGGPGRTWPDASADTS